MLIGLYFFESVDLSRVLQHGRWNRGSRGSSCSPNLQTLPTPLYYRHLGPHNEWLQISIAVTKQDAEQVSVLL